MVRRLDVISRVRVLMIPVESRADPKLDQTQIAELRRAFVVPGMSNPQCEQGERTAIDCHYCLRAQRADWERIADNPEVIGGFQFRQFRPSKTDLQLVP